MHNVKLFAFDLYYDDFIWIYVFLISIYIIVVQYCTVVILFINNIIDLPNQLTQARANAKVLIAAFPNFGQTVNASMRVEKYPATLF